MRAWLTFRTSTVVKFKKSGSIDIDQATVKPDDAELLLREFSDRRIGNIHAVAGGDIAHIRPLRRLPLKNIIATVRAHWLPWNWARHVIHNSPEVLHQLLASNMIEALMECFFLKRERVTESLAPPHLSSAPPERPPGSFHELKKLRHSPLELLSRLKLTVERALVDEDMHGDHLPNKRKKSWVR